jgi:quinolinate synthase
MAYMAAIEQVDQCWETLGRILPVEETVMPGLCGITAVPRPFVRIWRITQTSSNAKAVIEWSWARREKILFFPDEHLGRNTANKMGLPREAMIVWDPYQPNGGNTREAIQRAKLILWKGHCSGHQMFQPVHVDNFRKRYPDGKVIVHPECHEDVVNRADCRVHRADYPYGDGAAGSQLGGGNGIESGQSTERDLTDKTVLFRQSTVCQCATMFRSMEPISVGQ